jgi:spectinomycin phosphotransferase
VREDPGLDGDAIATSLAREYGLDVKALRFLPHGLDPYAAAYQVVTRDDAPYFLKIRSGPVNEPGLLVPRALQERGIAHVLAPVPARSSELWQPLEGYPGYTVVVYPYVDGENAMIAGLSDEQWRSYGATLRAVHDAGLERQFWGAVPVEEFDLPSAAMVRQLLELVESTSFRSQVAHDHAMFWRARTGAIHGILARTETLARRLRAKSFPLVLCHADIHAANILVGQGGDIVLIDWDGPRIAPRERDLLFVVGSQIARPVEPREEALFFAGYGPIEIDRDALIYFRYERIIEDFGEFGRSVFLDAGLSEAARIEEANMVVRFFDPDGQIVRAESI